MTVREQEGTFWDDGNVFVLILVVATQMYTFAKTQ